MGESPWGFESLRPHLARKPARLAGLRRPQPSFMPRLPLDVIAPRGSVRGSPASVPRRRRVAYVEVRDGLAACWPRQRAAPDHLEWRPLVERTLETLRRTGIADLG